MTTTAGRNHHGRMQAAIQMMSIAQTIKPNIMKSPMQYNSYTMLLP